MLLIKSKGTNLTDHIYIFPESVEDRNLIVSPVWGTHRYINVCFLVRNQGMGLREPRKDNLVFFIYLFIRRNKMKTNEKNLISTQYVYYVALFIALYFLINIFLFSF